MGEQPIWVAVVVNRLLGRAAAAVLGALHIPPANPEYPISNSVSMEILVVLIGMAFFLWLKGRISADRPGATQQVLEMVLTNKLGVGIRDLIHDNIHNDGDKYIPLIGTVGIFVLLSNLINVIPTLEAPTATVTVPLGCAIVVFVYYNLAGVSKQGALGHAKHFLGPVPLMAPLLLPIEVFSHSFRLLSLTVRLWVNMIVSELLYGVFLGLMLAVYVYLAKLNTLGYASALLPLTIPLIFIILHIFVAILQAFVFSILPIIYVSEAVAEHL